MLRHDLARTVAATATLFGGMFAIGGAMLAELGLAGFTIPMAVTCEDHAGSHSIYLQRWNGTSWEPATDWIAPMADRVRPLLEEAASAYIADKPDWQTQTCG